MCSAVGECRDLFLKLYRCACVPGVYRGSVPMSNSVWEERGPVCISASIRNEEILLLSSGG